MIISIILALAATAALKEMYDVYQNVANGKEWKFDYVAAVIYGIITILLVAIDAFIVFPITTVLLTCLCTLRDAAGNYKKENSK